MYRIYASEIASLVGKNPYKSQSEAIQDCVNRNTKGLPPLEILRAQGVCKKNKEVSDVFDQMMSDMRKTQTNDEVTEKKEAFKDTVTSVLVAPIDAKIENARSAGDEREVARLLREREAAIKDANHVTRAGQTHFNTNFGTRKEASIGETYEERTGMTVEKPQKTYEWPIIPGKAVVVGKFDGFADDGTLVEIKQRTRRLFGVVKEYENVQVHVYMKMAEVETAHLVEKFQNQLNIFNIYYDDDFMCDIEGELEKVLGNIFNCEL